MLNDLRFALRQLAKSPGFTAVAVLTLALGIGANTAIFSVMDTMLLRALPVENPEQLVEFVRVNPRSKMTNLPYCVFERLRDNHAVLSGLLAYWEAGTTFRAQGGSERVTTHQVSGAFFTTLGVKALLGRAIGPDDGRPGPRSQVTVLTYQFWSRQFGRDPGVLGTTVYVDALPLTVIGVMPPQFFGVDRSQSPDIWVPLSLNPRPGYVWMLGRLRPGVSIAHARAALAAPFEDALASLSEDDRGGTLELNRATTGTSGLRWGYWEYSKTLPILMALAALLILIACVNVANLMLARSAQRSSEIAIRVAVGASRWQLVRQSLVESLLLSVVGGGAGLLVARWGHQLLLAYLVGDQPQDQLGFRLDGRLLGFALAFALLTALLFGLAPAIRGTQRAQWLTPGPSTWHPGMARMPLSKGLLTVQMALSLILLLGAGLFARTLSNLASSDLGFRRENLVMLEVDPSGSGSRRGFSSLWPRLTERLAAVTGVQSLSVAGNAVFGSGGWAKEVWVQTGSAEPQHAWVRDNLVGPGFFGTVGVPLLMGREFGALDRADSPPVAVINQAFVRRFFGDANPIGRRLGDNGPGSAGRCEIVGLVRDTRYASLREPLEPLLYQPLSQEQWNRPVELHARTAGPPAAVLAALRREIQAFDKDIVVAEVVTLEEVVRNQLRHERMFATLASISGLLALCLAMIGLYGLISYTVTRRTHDIGIRLALGARPAAVLGRVLREAFIVALAGIALGVLAALALAPLLRNRLYGVEPLDATTMLASTGTLLGVTLAAAYLPARRAAKVDPMVALRCE